MLRGDREAIVISEIPFEVTALGADKPVWIHDFGLARRDGSPLALEVSGPRLTEAAARVWFHQMEDDAFNRLVVNPGLTWRQVVLLRAYAKFLRQAQIPFSETYMQNALAANPPLARYIVELFEARFDAALDPRLARIAEIRQAIQQGIDAGFKWEDLHEQDPKRLASSFEQEIRVAIVEAFKHEH